MVYNWIFNRQIKEMVGIESDYTGEDSRIAQINRTTTQTLENLLGRSLTKQEHTQAFTSKFNGKQYFDVYGNSNIGYGYYYKEIKYLLNNFPIDMAETFQVQYNSTNRIDEPAILTITTDYVVEPDLGKLEVLRLTGDYTRGLIVTYTAGYEETIDTEDGETDAAGEKALYNNLPADLVQAALWQAAHTYDKMKTSNINVRESRSQGSTNSSRFVNINAVAPEAMAIIVQNKRKFFRVV